MTKHLIFMILVLFQAAATAQESKIFQVILEPIQYTLVYPEVFSRVVALPKKLGDTFQEGDLLIGMDNDHFKANLVKAQKVAEKAEEDLYVKKELFQQHLLSKLELKEAEAELANAQAEVALAKLTIDRSQIRAGYSGKIASVTIRLYEYPVEFKVMLAYLNDERLIANFLIPASVLKRIHPGERVYILILDLEEIIPARLTRIAPDVNPTSGTVRVEAEFANPDGRWKAGMVSVASFDLSALLEQNPLAPVLPEPEKIRTREKK